MTRQPELQTQRLILRPFELTDASNVQRLAGDYAIADTTINIPHPYKDGMAAQWISQHQAKFYADKLCNYAVVLRTTDELVGSIGLVISRHSDRAELGY
jgi:ribosomal-protein-alanine N-acetyltransferase